MKKTRRGSMIYVGGSLYYGPDWDELEIPLSDVSAMAAFSTVEEMEVICNRILTKPEVMSCIQNSRDV